MLRMSLVEANRNVIKLSFKLNKTKTPFKPLKSI
jgi:hypothetical protein